MAVREIHSTSEVVSGNPLTQMFETEGFLNFLDELDEFENLDTTGENPTANARIEKMYGAYKGYPAVVKDLQDLWKSKADVRKVTFAPESLKRVEDEMLAAIKSGNIEIVDQFARQVAEYKALPFEIEAKKQEIGDFEAKMGDRNKLQKERRGMSKKVEEKNERLNELSERREAKDAIGKNREILESTQKYIDTVLKGVKAEQLRAAWQVFENKPEIFFAIANSPESAGALSKFDKPDVRDNPLAIIREIKRDKLADDSEPIVAERVRQNLQKLIEIVKQPAIKAVLDKFICEAKTRKGIEDLEQDPGKRAKMLKNRDIRSDLENINSSLSQDNLEKIAVSSNQISELSGRLEVIQNTLGNSIAADRFKSYCQQLRGGMAELNKFDRATLKDAGSSWEIAGQKPGIFIKEFFTKHGPRQRSHAVRKAGDIEKKIGSLDDLEMQKAELEEKYNDARKNIFKTFAQAESLIADMEEKVDEKFGVLLADEAGLKGHFDAADYFDLLADIDTDDDLEMVKKMPEVETRSGSIAESKKALSKKVAERMVTEIKKSLASLEKITPKKLDAKLKNILTGLGESIANNPKYKEIELAALRIVYADKTIKTSRRKTLENLFPQLRNVA